jgi:hypothetical protein
MEDNNVIQFPVWIIEKERELAALEREILMDKTFIEMEKQKIRVAKRNSSSQALMFFVCGILVMGCIMIPFLFI